MKTIAIEFLLRASLLLCTLLILSSPIERIAERIRMQNRLRERKRRNEGKRKWQRKLDEVLLVVFGLGVTADIFACFDLALTVTAFTLFTKLLGLQIGVLGGLVIGLLPWLFLYERFETKRRKGSLEGTALVSEILRRYRVSGRNLYVALEETAPVKELRVTGKLLYHLLLSLRDAKGSEAIHKATDDFSYGLGTNWGRMLSYNIAIAAETGRDITAALEDLMIQLRDAEKLAEERKRMNSETARIINWFLPILYPASLLMMRRAMDLTWETIFYNQFRTEKGVLMLLAIVFLWGMNAVLLTLVTERKFDF